MKLVLSLCALVVVAWTGPAVADDSDGAKAAKKSIETPAEALQKVQRTHAEESAESFGGGLWLVDSPDSDLREPLPLATRREFEEAGYDVVTDQEDVPYTVDAAGRIYHVRNYHGIIPGIRTWLHPRDRTRSRHRGHIYWMGYQPYEAISRVFWHFPHAAPQFEIQRLDRYTVEVRFPESHLMLRNHGRAMITEKFRGPIESVRRVRQRRGTRFLVKLKRPANFLYRYEAPFLFLDFEN